MIRFTTPTLPLIVEADLTGMDIYASLSQGCIKLTKKCNDYSVEDNQTTINLPLTQEETGKFKADEKIDIQVNWINSIGNRGATVTKTILTIENLLNEVIEYGN